MHRYYGFHAAREIGTSKFKSPGHDEDLRNGSGILRQHGVVRDMPQQGQERIGESAQGTSSHGWWKAENAETLMTMVRYSLEEYKMHMVP